MLVTKPDFRDSDSRANLKTTLEELLKMHSIPIVNANDVVAPPPSQDLDLAGVCLPLYLCSEESVVYIPTIQAPIKPTIKTQAIHNYMIRMESS